jgi:hypothetical protein
MAIGTMTMHKDDRLGRVFRRYIPTTQMFAINSLKGNIFEWH